MKMLASNLGAEEFDRKTSLNSKAHISELSRCLYLLRCWGQFLQRLEKYDILIAEANMICAEVIAQRRRTKMNSARAKKKAPF
jgi:hypothetical protein